MLGNHQITLSGPPGFQRCVHSPPTAWAGIPINAFGFWVGLFLRRSGILFDPFPSSLAPCLAAEGCLAPRILNRLKLKVGPQSKYRVGMYL